MSEMAKEKCSSCTDKGPEFNSENDGSEQTGITSCALLSKRPA